MLEGGKRVGKLGEGAVWGEAQFLTEGAAPLGVRAMERCEVLRLRRSVVDQLRRRYPALKGPLEAAKASAEALDAIGGILG